MPTNRHRHRRDVVVVGARAAGAATALQLARLGRFTVKGDAPAEKLRELVEQSRARSAVYDVITNRVPITIEVATN